MIIGIAKAVVATIITIMAVAATTITTMVVVATTITTMAAAATTIITVAVVTKQNAKGQSKDCSFIYYTNNRNCSITQN